VPVIVTRESPIVAAQLGHGVIFSGPDREAVDLVTQSRFLLKVASMDATRQLSQLLDVFYDSVSSGEVGELERHIAPDILIIGTDPTEWLQGRNEVLPVLRAQFSEMSKAGVTLTRTEPTIGMMGAAGWAAASLTIHLPAGNNVPVRVTMVATQESERWLIQQMHLSIGVDNEQVFEQVLTT
jgi:hypothetical protein